MKNSKYLVTLIRYAKEVVTFFIVMTILANVISIYKSGDLNKNSLNMVNITLLNNIDYKLPIDKPILIHIWATWCPTCKLEASNIQTISESFEVLTIVVKSGTNTEVNEYLKDNSLDFNVVNDNSGFIASQFNIAAYPTTFIYNKDKKLLFSEVGYTSTLGLWLRMWWASF